MSRIPERPVAYVSQARQTGALKLSVAYDGAREPVGLWSRLDAAGWTIPPRPSTPAHAIDWTPDPATGRDHTIRSWAVEDFRISAPAGEIAASDAFLTATHDALVSAQVQIEIDPALAARLQPSEAASQAPERPAADHAAVDAASTAATEPSATSHRPDAAAPRSPSAVTPQPRPDLVAIIEPEDRAAATNLGLQCTTASRASRPDGMVWAEASTPEPPQRGWAADTTMAWVVQHRDAAPSVADGRATLAIVVPDSRDDGGLVQRLTSISSDPVAVSLLEPIGRDQRPHIGLLIMTVVDADKHAKISSVLQSAYPQILIRGRSSASRAPVAMLTPDELRHG